MLLHSNEVHRPKSQLTQAPKTLPVPLIFCIGMKWYNGLVWILLTMCARSLQANRGGGAGLSWSLMHGLADIVQSHPWTFHCRRQSRSASRTRRSCKLEKQNPCCLRMLRCVAILDFLYNNQAGRKPGIGPFAYLGPKHFPRSGYVDIFPPDHWPMIPMIKPEPNQMHNDSDFHPMENYVNWFQMEFEESWLRREHQEFWCLGRSGKISIHQDFEWIW